MFHPEIPYSEALRRGVLQARMLQELDPGEGGAFDPLRAGELIREHLPPG